MATKSDSPIESAPSNGKLPEGWRMVQFGDVVRDVKESERNPLEAGLERYIGLEHIAPENLHITEWGDLTQDEVSFTKRFRNGQVLFGKRRAYQRKVALAEFDGICSSDILTFEPKDDELIPDLLPFIVQSDAFFNHALGTSSGSLSPRTRWSQLKDFVFPLPPQSEQRRIADMFWSVDDSIEQYSQSAIASNRLRRVLLFEFMSGRESHEQTKETEAGSIPASWNVSPVGEAGNVQLGRQRAPKYQTGKHTKPYLRVANVFDGYFDFSDVLEMDFDANDFETYLLEPGDILLNEGQSRELVGRCAIYGGEIADCCFQNTLVRFRAGDGLLPEFAFFYFQYLFYKGVFASISRQTTSIAHLGAERFSKLPMAVPPMPEQERIVNTLNAVINECRRIERHRGLINDVKRGMMDATLSGKLTH